MTDRINALACLAETPGPTRDAALEEYYAANKDKPLNMLKWLAVQVRAGFGSCSGDLLVPGEEQRTWGCHAASRESPSTCTSGSRCWRVYGACWSACLPRGRMRGLRDTNGERGSLSDREGEGGATHSRI